MDINALAERGIHDMEIRSHMLLWLSDVIQLAKVVGSCSKRPLETRLRIASSWLSEALETPEHLPAATSSILLISRAFYAEAFSADRYARDQLKTRMRNVAV